MNALKATSNSGVIDPMIQMYIRWYHGDPLPEEIDGLSANGISLDNIMVTPDAASTTRDCIDLVTTTGNYGVTCRNESNGAFDNGNVFCDLSNDGNEDESTEIKYTIDFLKPFLREKDKLQPNALVQQYYSGYQHEQDRQSHTKSIKPWFHYTEKRDSCEGIWWTSQMFVPFEVAIHLGFDLLDKSPLHIMSGYLPLSLNGWETVESIYNTDVLNDLFGEYKKLSQDGDELLWFKKKSAAQKSASLNFLFLMNDQKGAEIQAKSIKYKMWKSESFQQNQYPSWVNRLYAMGFGSKTSQQSLKLHSIKHLAAVRDHAGKLLSSNNPCLITCIVTYSDNDSESNGEITKVKSGGYFSAQESFEDVLRCLESSISPNNLRCHNPSVEMQEKDYILTKYDNIISYEVALPRWSTSKIGSQLFLYELKFHKSISAKQKEQVLDSMRDPLAHTYGLKLADSTRFGLVTGCDIFEDWDKQVEELSADFTIPNSQTFKGPISVVLCNKTCIHESEMETQLLEYKYNEPMPPIALLKCFNAIMLDNGGRTYGMKPHEHPNDIISQLNMMSASECDRTYFFVPLDPRYQEDLRATEKFRSSIDWEVVTNVVNGVSTLMPAQRTSRSIHSNRFMKQPIGFNGNLFILDEEELKAHPTTISPLFLEDEICTISSDEKARFNKRYNMQLDKATYASYHICWQKWKHPKMPVNINYQNERLIKTRHVVCHADHDFTVSDYKRDECDAIKSNTRQSISQLLATRGYLIPKLIELLPMPRDLLYMAQHSRRFMTALERAHLLHEASAQLLCLKARTSQFLSTHEIPDPSFTNLVDLIDKALEIGYQQTREDERLESLGDVVLMFLIVINLFSCSSNIYDCVLETFKTQIEKQAKNNVLNHGALIIGLHRLCSNKELFISSWSSSYLTNPVSKSKNTTTYMKRLSNTFESLLGASYLLDYTGAMAVGILNEIAPCITYSGYKGSATPALWFTSKSTCLNEGYHFGTDSLWTSELNRIQNILQEEPLVLCSLQSGTDKLLNHLFKDSGRHDLITTIQSQSFSLLMIESSLFDDSLDDMNAWDTSDKLLHVAIFRDKLFHVGHATLLFSLVNEIYNNHPNVTSGDIHFSKAYILSDDALAYILIKNGINEYLFDKQDDAITAFSRYMHLADSLGKEFWAEHNGWVGLGGIAEFRRRMKLMSDGTTSIDMPHYVGLAAGRLFGQKASVPKHVSENLVFSMKTIVGALTLSVGREGAWSLVRPLFLELLLLSPDETRQTYTNVSDLASKCKKGKR